MSASATTDPYIGNWEGGFVDPPDDYRFHIRDCYAKVIATGEETYRVILSPHPFQRTPSYFDLLADRSGDNALSFETDAYRGTFKEGVFVGALMHEGDWVGFKLKKTEYRSPTLNAEAPSGAIILFDGNGFEHWMPVDEDRKSIIWEIEDEAMRVVSRATHGDPSTDIRSRKQFADVFLHLEFQLPFEPDKQGQGRGNSGIFLQDIYEVQILDSFGLEGVWNECGALYEISAPRINMCAPPGQWQTFDILFHAPKFNEAGDKIGNAKTTIHHNGVCVQLDQELPHSTMGPDFPETTNPGHLILQDHNHPVRFRNIWAVDISGGSKVPNWVEKLPKSF